MDPNKKTAENSSGNVSAASQTPNLSKPLPSEQEVPLYKPASPVSDLKTEAIPPVVIQSPTSTVPPANPVNVNPVVNNQGLTSVTPTPDPVPQIPVPPPPPQQPTNTQVLASNNNQPKTILYILVLIIVVITFIALGLIALNYPKFNANVINKNQAQTKTKVEIAQPTISIDPNPDITILNQQGDSDEVEAIKADLSATDLNNIDKEVENISVELNQ